MDSGDRSNNQLKAPDSGFGGGLRSQSFSNLFQGFFGVKSGPTSMTDIRSGEFEEKPSEESSLETIVSPSHDESWIFSHYLQARREQDDKNLRRNVTCSELRKIDRPLLLRDSASANSSAASSTTDISRIEFMPVPRISESEFEGSGSELKDKGEELAKPKIVVAKKNVEVHHYQKNILSSFLSHELPHFEARRNEHIAEPEHSQHQVDTRVAQAASASGTGEATGLGDGVDGNLLPGATTSGDKGYESKQTLRDFLWSFNHEKINVSKKEMNLIASIDQ